MHSDRSKEDRFARAEQLLGDWLASSPKAPWGAVLAANPDVVAELDELAAGMGLVEAVAADGRQRLAAQAAETEKLLHDLGRGAEFGPRYAVEGEIGKGGMGAVFRVLDKKLGRPLAMKVILGQVEANRSGKTPAVAPAQLQRFLNEARITGQLQHPGIVPVHEVGVDGEGRAYFTMKLVQGRTLGAVFALQRDGDPAWPRRRVVATIQRVCEAVAYAHGKGVVHRDLKPGNVMVGDHGEVYVMDWGLARRLDEAEDAATESAVDAELSAQVTMTRDGAVLGTPAYMPPEQASGRVDEIGPPADVYAIGAMLYESIAGHAPYCGPGEDSNGSAVLRRIVAESPGPLAAPGVPPELVAICAKAMAHDWRHRYATVEELAQELGAFVDRRVVRAYATGARAELVKWVQRNRALASSVAALVMALVAGIGGTWWLAERNAVIAQEKTELAGKETAAKEEASRLAAEKGQLAEEKGRTVAQFHQLSAVVRLEDAIAKQDALWPAWPDKIAALQEWLDKDCAELLAQRPQIEATIAELRSKALPPAAEQAEADRRAAAEWPAYERQQQLVAALRRAQAIRAGASKLELPKLPAELQNADASALKSFAWLRVAPERPDGEQPERTTFGEEAAGLVAARAAVAKSAGTPEAFQFLATLAWAALANGQDDEAKQRTAEALAKAPAKERDAYLGYQRDIEAAIGEAPTRLAVAEAKLTALDAKVSVRRTWTFGGDEESRSAEFLHKALVDVLAGLNSMAANERADMAQRLTWAQQVEAASITAHRERWAAARQAILRADGATASDLYRAAQVDLPPQIGLVPIGMNSVTKLWEFYDLRSAWDGKQAAAEIAIPTHKEDGSIEIKAGTGIVFVLLPGGRVTLGSQTDDPKKPFYVRQRKNDETLHEVTLAPFFLARHELTQRQWSGLWTWDAELREPSQYKAGQTIVGKRITLANPVEQVDWVMCEQLLTRHGMVLPTEAQWEYGCRGGTTTVWSVAFEQLGKVANVAEAEAKAEAPEWGNFESWRDGHVVHAPVGTFAANAFGLHDVHGNVWEWCRDWHGDYGSERAGDGLRSVCGLGNRTNRGGSYSRAAVFARSAYRNNDAPSVRVGNMGLRPARLIAD